MTNKILLNTIEKVTISLVWKATVAVIKIKYTKYSYINCYSFVFINVNCIERNNYFYELSFEIYLIYTLFIQRIQFNIIY